MRKQTSRLLCITICFASLLTARAQEPITQTSDVWTVDYRVVVTGDFTIEGDAASYQPTINYHLKREYLGKGTLRFDPKAGGKPGAGQPVFKDPNVRVRIKVNDFVNTIYPIICDEWESIEEIWTADVDSTFGNEEYRVPGLLLIDSKALRYKTSFPILYNSPKQNFGEVIYKKTRYMNPGHLPKDIHPEKKESFDLHEYPNVKGYIEGNSIRVEGAWSQLTQHPEGYISWLSPVLHPDKPLFRGIPDSKDKVNILIHFAIRKQTAK